MSVLALAPVPDATALPSYWHDARALRVLGMGTALPGSALSTEALLEHVESRFGISVARRGRAFARKLGIHTRHICRDFDARHESPRPGDSNPELAARAVSHALADAGIEAADLGYLIGHTASPARLMPPNAAQVADQLGYAGPYVELRQACTGFANALVIAQGLLAAPGAAPIAIVGSETGSVYFDPLRTGDDVGQIVNLVQMGDGAAAIVLAPDAPGPGARLRDVYFGHIGLGREPGFCLSAGGSNASFVETGALEFEHDFAAVRQCGPELFERGAAVAAAIGTPIGAAEQVIPHQANGRLDELLGPFLQIEPERVFVNADRVGNTGSAAIWLALDQVRRRLERGERAHALGAEATKYMFGGFSYVHG